MMRRTLKSLAALALLGGVTLAVAPTAHAGLLPVTQTAVADGSNWRYTYGIVLTTDAHIVAGDSFTIYDFAGLVPGTIQQPSGWTPSTANVTLGNKTVPNDDPTLPNITWTYTGSTIFGQKGLGNFSVESSVGQTQNESFIARTHRDVDNHIDDNITDVTVPLQPKGGPGGNTPEPATLALMGLGLPLAGAFRMLRNRRK
jgi:hypothetical protein